nr:MAG TPA: minor tail protein [Caudoviricetes sp.]
MAISGADGSIVLTTKVDQSGLNNGMSTMKSGVAKMSASFAKLGGVIATALSVKALINFGKQSIELASDIQEVQNVVDVAFGDMSYKIERFSETAIEQFGISELTAKKTASTYMAMAKGMGITSDVGSDMAITLTGLTADMASFYNVSQDVADTAIKSIFTGETETLKNFGIVMTEVNLEQFALSQGITKSISAMTQQEKTMLRYNFVLQKTALAQGDFSRTSNSWANQTRVLTERWKEMQSQFGQAFVSIGTLVLPVINSIISGLSTIAQYANIVAQSIYKAFTGQEINVSTAEDEAQVISSAVDNQNELTESIKETEKAQKGALAGFDEVNTLTQQISEDVGNKEIKIPSVQIPTIPNSEIKKQEKSSKFLDAVKVKLQPIISALRNLRDAVQPFAENVGEGLYWLYENILKPMGDWALTTLIPTVLDLISAAIEFLNEIIEAAKPTLQWIWDNFFKPLMDFLWQTIIDFLEMLTDAFKKLTDWAKENPETMQNIATIIIGFLAGLWVYNSSKKIISFISDLTKKLKDFGGLKKMLESVGTAINSPALALGALTSAGLFWVQNWDKIKSAFEGMSAWQKVIVVVLGLAAAIAVLWVALSAGLAAAGIVAGLAAIGIGATILAIGAKNQENVAPNAQLQSIPTGDAAIASTVPAMTVGGYTIPKLARGAVVPPNREFMAVLGDNTRETEIVSPLSTMEQAFENVLSRMGGINADQDINVSVIVDSTEIARATRKGENRLGKQTVFGGFANAH